MAGLTQAAAADLFNTSPKMVAKWVKRFRVEGVEGLRDRFSRPHSSRSQTPACHVHAVEALRRQLRDLEPAEPERRYERESPGEIIHIEIKKAWALRAGWPPHHRRSEWSEQRAAAPVGISSTSALTTIPALPSPRSNRTRRRSAMIVRRMPIFRRLSPGVRLASH